jgi:hypothetical protein
MSAQLAHRFRRGDVQITLGKHPPGDVMQLERRAIPGGRRILLRVSQGDQHPQSPVHAGRAEPQLVGQIHQSHRLRGAGKHLQDGERPSNRVLHHAVPLQMLGCASIRRSSGRAHCENEWSKKTKSPAGETCRANWE